jgi:hypothetical protein
MNDKDRKRYIQEIFKHCTTDSILVIDQKGHLTRLRCPFNVVVIVDVRPLKKGQEKAVIAVKVSENLIDVYIIEKKAFYHYNFRIIS